ncbi:MAG: hypothetical protein NTZ11_09680 [Gammaproteobacteria bacterium]|nr:hypothetical protein [Gammaproteobacteria bacterium]
MRFNTVTHWLRILLALAMTPLLATSVFAAERTQVTEEHLVQTKNGCNTVLRIEYSSEYPTSKEFIELRKDSLAKSEWDGECANGLTTGAGKLIEYNLDGAPMMYSEGVHLNGMAIGFSKKYMAKGDDLVLEEYVWNGTEYSQLNLHRLPLAPRRWNDRVPLLRKSTPTERIVVTLLQDAASGDIGRCDKQTGVMSCVKYVRTAFRPCADHSLEKCKTWDDPEETIYPCSNDCLQKWNQLTQPLLVDYQEFVNQTQPELDAAVNMAMAPILAARAEKIRQQETFAEHTRRNFASAARVQQALNNANQLRRPVAGPNLDALIKKIKESKP